MKKTWRHIPGIAVAANYFTAGANAARAAADAMRAAQAEAQKLLNQFSGAGLAQQAGRIAEPWHMGIYNANAALGGRPDLVATLRPPAGPMAAGPDVVVMRQGQEVAQAQLKYLARPAQTTLELSRPAYTGMQKVAPLDQVARVRELAAQRAQSGTLRAAEFRDTAQTATDRISVAGVTSRPLTKAGAEGLAKNPGRIGAAGLATEAAQALKGGAIAGAYLGGVCSAVSNLSAFTQGQKSGAEALTGVAVDAARSAVAGATVSAGTVAARGALLRAGFRGLSRSAAPVALAATVYDAAAGTADDLRAFSRGEIGGGELAGRVAANTGKAAVRGGCGWAGMEAGAAIGTAIMPGVGTVVLGVLGGLAGFLFGSKISR